jgi:methyl-accepting chemotaxis protein
MFQFSVKFRLFVLFLMPLLLLVGTSFFLLRLNDTNVKDLTSSLYETTEQSTSLILNADRDMYQGLLAYQLVASGTLNATDRAAQIVVTQENIEQTKERVDKAYTILKQKGLLNVTHSESNISFEENFQSFNTLYGQWEDQVTPAMQTDKIAFYDLKLMDTFEKGRQGLNQIGEILDEYAKSSIDLIQTKNENTKWTILTILSLLIIITLAYGYLTIRQITKTIQRIVGVTGKIAEGDLCHEPQHKYAADELGQISQSVDTMAARMKKLIGVIAENTQHVRAASIELTGSSRETATTADHISKNIQVVTSDVEIQSRSVEETSRAIEEMAIGIQRVAENTTSIADHSAQTAQQAEMGSEVLRKLIAQMGDIVISIEQLSINVESLNRKSEEIDIIALSITDFSNQTNLLSLNASIEAARAGEHGRGFSVVSNEIRKLASQSIKSADEINQLVRETRNEINMVSGSVDSTRKEAHEGSTLMNEVNKSFETIVRSVKEIVPQLHETSAITEQMSAGSEEISASMEQSSRTANQIYGKSQDAASATQQQLTMIDNIAASAEQLSLIVDSLDESVAYFKIV